MEAEAEGSQVQRLPGLQSKFKVSPGNLSRSCLKGRKERGLEMPDHARAPVTCLAWMSLISRTAKVNGLIANRLIKHSPELCLYTLTLFSLLPGKSVSISHHGHPVKSFPNLQLSSWLLAPTFPNYSASSSVFLMGSAPCTHPLAAATLACVFLHRYWLVTPKPGPLASASIQLPTWMGPLRFSPP